MLVKDKVFLFHFPRKLFVTYVPVYSFIIHFTRSLKFPIPSSAWLLITNYSLISQRLFVILHDNFNEITLIKFGNKCLRKNDWYFTFNEIKRVENSFMILRLLTYFLAAIKRRRKINHFFITDHQLNLFTFFCSRS